MNRYLSLIAFSHTVFALPFALIMLVVVHRSYPVSVVQLVLILVSLIAARTSAMGFNRVIDSKIDAKNPRTAGREIPAGKITLVAASTLTSIATVVFLLAAYGLGTHCLIAAPLVVIVLLGYSLAKRFTPYAHMILGLALALAPGGVWYAITARFSFVPLPLMAAVLCWVSGFDVLYSLQDLAFDKSAGLYSIPVRFGREKSKVIAFFLHVVAVLFLALFFMVVGAGRWTWSGIALFGALLLSQHIVVRIVGEKSINQLFFTANGVASVLLLFSVLMDGWG